jgi:hypothetical protein
VRKKNWEKNQLTSRLKSLVPRGKRERRRLELWSGAAVVTTLAFVVLIFLISSLDRMFMDSSQYASVISAVLVDLANNDRATNNLGHLTINSTLVAAAQAKADDMAAKGYFAHVAPDGRNSWYWFQQAGYAFEYAGENLAVDFSDSVDVNSAWMNSPSHRENIMNGHFTEVGIATAAGMFQGHPTIFVVQMFGNPAPVHAAQAVTEEVVPKKPTEIAVATTKPVTKPVVKLAQVPAPITRVLGSATEVAQAKPAPVPTPVAEQSAVDYAPLWAHIAASPRTMLRYIYYALGLLVLLGLLIETGLEFRWHHAHKAMKVGAVLATMAVLFVLADYFVFTQPVLAVAAGLFTS